MAEPNIRWCESEDGNFCHESLAELLESRDDIEPGATVYFGEAVEPGTKWIDASYVIEKIGDRAYDEAPEHADLDFPRVSDVAKAELDAFLTQWQAQHCRADFWTIPKVQTHVVTAEDIADAR
jgi:hypothetical protein